MKETFKTPQDPKNTLQDKPKKRFATSMGPDVPLSSPLDPEHARNHREAYEYEKNKKI
jgi:hypothetical protein